MTRRRAANAPPDLTDNLLRSICADVKHNRIPVTNGRIRITDGRQSGLIVNIYKGDKGGDPNVAFHAGYRIGASRPLVKIGDYPEMSLEKARKITKIIQELGSHGVDVEDGFHQRLIRELERDGAKWRPWDGYKPHA